MSPRVVAVMPAFNEAEGIAEFLDEIATHLGAGAQYVVVDDKSGDDTAAVVRSCASRGLPVTLVSNEQNLGHGPSTIKALKAGLAHDPDVIVAVDGDGQFLGADIARLVELALSADLDVVEGVRRGREDPVFRRVTSAVTRTLVGLRARTLPRDANTPLRVYRPAALAELVDRLPDDAMTPNLLISVMARRSGMTMREENVVSRTRRGGDSAGSTWRARHARLPSRRYVQFCLKAGLQWLTLSRR